jgi:hypothetical protein
VGPSIVDANPGQQPGASRTGGLQTPGPGGMANSVPPQQPLAWLQAFDAQTASAGSHGHGVADLNFLKGCDDSFGAAAAEVVKQVVAVPAALPKPMCVIQGQTLSGGASTVMARVAANVGSGTTSSPGSALCTSSSVEPHRNCQGRYRRRARTSAAVVAAAAPAIKGASLGFIPVAATSGWYR